MYSILIATMLRRIIHAFLALFLTAPLFVNGQIDLPRISPNSTIAQTIGLTDVEVSYSRPSKRGRQLLGELIPYGQVWRLGANESTKFRTSQVLLVNGDSLEAGTYALYAVPEEDAFQIIFHADTTVSGNEDENYDPQQIVLTVESPVYYERFNVENFRIDFQELQHDRATMVIAWGEFRVACELTVFTDAFVMKDIEKQIWTNPTAKTYYQSARYLQEQGKDQENALRYLDKAEIIGGPTLYIYRVRSLVLAQQNKFIEAIEAAEASKSLAQDEGNDEFVRLNRRSIRLWRKEIRN